MGERLNGKVAVITGAASGIGEATARLFAAEGARVVIADLQAARAATVAAEIGVAARAIACDVTREAEVEAAVALAVAEFGRLDIMVNNAGLVGAVGSIREISDAHWQATIAVLLGSVFYGMKHAARVMVAQGQGGSIISVSSTAGVVGWLGPHVYTAAKHGVVGLTESVASELAPHGIRVNAVAPGTTATQLIVELRGGRDAALQFSADRSPMHQTILAADIANGFLYLASDEGRHVTAQTLVIDGGVTGAGLSVATHHTRPAGFVASTRMG